MLILRWQTEFSGDALAEPEKRMFAPRSGILGKHGRREQWYADDHVNGHSKSNGIMSNGINGSDGENEGKSETSSLSSLSNGNSRSLPPVPKEERPPPLPTQPPRTDKLPPRIKVSKPPSAPKFIPEKEIVIPNDGNLSSFATDDMCTFFKHMGIEDRIVNFLQKKSLDGKKFSKLKDNDLETIGISNPVIIHFRDKSRGSPKKKVPFML
ncbi:hypothetical protein FSP39_012514 [Pinctada imbricata]|uniref:SAM domain-containing protein n=1 Tax=Pinctada imbricata TaxID=66713 RepID=A0AA88Y0P7_PINIB|nr:hypothetical protein FSP39_012514 [Pinctada imbricata]